MPDDSRYDHGAHAHAFFSSVIVVSSFFLGARLWSRAVVPCAHLPLLSRFWWDDYSAALTLPFIVVGSGIGIRLVVLGFGRRVSDIEPSAVNTVFKLLYIYYLLYAFAATLPKASALFFYARVFSARTNVRLRHVLWATGALSGLWLVATIFVAAFQCKPAYKAWNTEVQGTCIGVFQYRLPVVVVNSAIDLVILLIPMPWLWKLQLKPLRKFHMFWVFALGYCPITVQMGQLVILSRMGVRLDDDVTFESVPVSYWQHLEAPVSLVSICLPAVFCLVKKCARFGPRYLFTAKTPHRKSNRENEADLARSSELNKDITIFMDSKAANEGSEHRPGEFAFAAK